MGGVSADILCSHQQQKWRQDVLEVLAYWPVFWGREGDFFLLTVTQKEAGEAHQEFKGRYMNGVLDA